MKPESIDKDRLTGGEHNRIRDEEAQSRRRKGAWESAVVATVLFLLSGGVLLFLKYYFQVEGFWGAVLLITAVATLVMILPIWVLLKTRLKEIEGGEEDAAAKY